jgi:hypothetical protein
MLIHNNGWEIIRDTGQIDGRGGYWLKPPKERDPHQQLIEMPSKNPLIAAMRHARNNNARNDNARTTDRQLAS